MTVWKSGSFSTVPSIAWMMLAIRGSISRLRGGEPYTPEVLLGLLLYGYATGVFSARKIERVTTETVPFRYIAYIPGNVHPDHDTIAAFARRSSLARALVVEAVPTAICRRQSLWGRPS